MLVSEDLQEGRVWSWVLKEKEAGCLGSEEKGVCLGWDHASSKGN